MRNILSGKYFLQHFHKEYFFDNNEFFDDSTLFFTKYIFDGLTYLWIH